MLRNASVVLLSACALVLGACSTTNTGPADSGPTPVSCTGTPPVCTITTANGETNISNAIAGATAGTTFTFAAGTFPFKNTITVPGVANLTFQGAGIGQTTLEFSGQTAGSGGISATGGNSNIKFENFTIQNTRGDGIKVEKGFGVVFSKVQVQWTNAADGGPDYLRHGGYGIYPVQSQNVLVDHCDISGARDTGAYIGQSYNIVVSNNNVHDNVAGIEIESSVSADVHDNTAKNNSGGILVFALPTLSPPPDAGQNHDGTLNVRVYNNTVTANNTPNFADPSGDVAQVPGGSGIILLAANYVEVFNNNISNNGTLAVANASYLVLDPSFNPLDPAQNPTGLNPFSNMVYVHDNTFANNGGSPQGTNVFNPDGGSNGPNQLGELFQVLILYGAWSSAPDIIWDGIAPPPYAPPHGDGDAGVPPNPLNYYFANNHGGSGTGSDWVNVNLPVVYTGGTSLNVNALAFAAGPFTVTSPPAGFPLPAVDAGILP